MDFKNARLFALLLFYINLLVAFSKGEYCSFKLGRTFKSKEKCTNLEHCVNNVFDTRTGQCVGASNHCEPKWMGPGCQYQNLAVNPENYDMVYDGNLTTHRSIEKATVNLNGKYNVTVVNIYTVYSTPVHIKIEDDQKFVVYDGFLNQGPKSLHFNHSTISTHLYIWFSAKTDIREIQVFGGKNVALWQRTSQVGHDEDPGGLDLSGGAVDGWDDSIDFVPISCTLIYSLKKSSFWKVSLDGFYALKYIVVSFANATNFNPDDFTLTVRTRNGTELSIYRYMKPRSPSSRKAVSQIIIDSSYMPSSLVNEVIIRGGSQRNILTLCEVSVYACSPTSTEENCRSFCPEYCHPSEKCHTGNFTCSRCQSGWTGPRCEQPVDQHSGESSTSHALAVGPIAGIIITCLILCLVCVAMIFRSKRKIRLTLRNPVTKTICFEIDLGHYSIASTEEEKENSSDFEK
uniref:Uncharacterized protein LOC111118499 n=1 Tax=Crassostrea virginica TaxID=6565 RepID=A0A8B8CGS6_CRAVI|nr:uncharacterized protein LOC111118499 [Crassostrea virginica]